MFLLLCASIAYGFDLTYEDYKQHWQKWKSFYGKTYESKAVDDARFAVWKDNLKVTTSKSTAYVAFI